MYRKYLHRTMLTNETKRYIYESVMATMKNVVMAKLNESFGNTESIEVLVSSLKGDDASTAVITAPTMDECVKKAYIVYNATIDNEFFRLKFLEDNLKKQMNELDDEWLENDIEQLYNQLIGIDDIDDFITCIENV